MAVWLVPELQSKIFCIHFNIVFASFHIFKQTAHCTLPASKIGVHSITVQQKTQQIVYIMGGPQPGGPPW